MGGPAGDIFVALRIQSFWNFTETVVLHISEFKDELIR